MDYNRKEWIERTMVLCAFLTISKKCEWHRYFCLLLFYFNATKHIVLLHCRGYMSCAIDENFLTFCQNRWVEIDFSIHFFYWLSLPLLLGFFFIDNTFLQSTDFFNLRALLFVSNLDKSHSSVIWWTFHVILKKTHTIHYKYETYCCHYIIHHQAENSEFFLQFLIL